MKNIALNEWLLPGWRADDLNDGEWAEAACPLFRRLAEVLTDYLE